MSAARRSAAVALVLCGGLSGSVLSGCASKDSPDAKSTQSPSTSVSVTPTPTATPSPSVSATPTPSPSAEPLSRFEDVAAVKALRLMWAETGRAVNAKDAALTKVKPLLTPKMQANFDTNYGGASGEIAKGYTWPGPTPFTPVKIDEQGNTALVSTCTLTSGWSRLGDNPAKQREVLPIDYRLVRVDNDWKLDALTKGTGDCAGVKIVEQKW